jgi:hypothetical protein
MNVRIYPDKEVPEDLEQLAVASEKIIDLDLLARLSGPYHTGIWARACGVPRYYVDDCWVFLPLRRQQLIEFNQDRLGGRADLSALEGYPNDALFVLESEEY